MGVILGSIEDGTGAHVVKRNKTDLMGWLGLRSPREMRRVRWLGPVVSTLTAVAGSVLLVVVVVEFIAASMGDDPDATALRNAGLVLAAVLGVPFLIWRTLVAQKQADVAEQALFNDKLKAAADDLHARREIRRKKKLDDAEELGFIEDDIVRRVTAIDRLEALAQERPEEAPRIARLLCVYLRQLSKSIGPDHEEHPRADMEAAAQTIGRMKRIEGVEPEAVEIDLRAANLAGFDLRDLLFDDAMLQDAKLSTSDLRGASLRRANLQICQLDKAQLNHADMRDAKLGHAFLYRARLANAHMQRAVLANADLCEADLLETGLQGALLSAIDLDNGTGLQSALLRGSAMWMFDLSRATHLKSLSLDQVFGDASMKVFGLPPAHWEQESLRWDEFEDRWRAWQKEIGFDPDDPATW